MKTKNDIAVSLFKAFEVAVLSRMRNNITNLKEKIIKGERSKNKVELYSKYKQNIMDIWDDWNICIDLLLPYGASFNITDIKYSWISYRDNFYKELNALLANYRVRKGYYILTSKTPFKNKVVILPEDEYLVLKSYEAAPSIEITDYQQVYEVTYKLINPIELLDTPFRLPNVTLEDISYYKEEGYDGLIYIPSYPTAEKTSSSVYLFTPKEAIIDVSLIDEGYMHQEGYWVKTLKEN